MGGAGKISAVKIMGIEPNNVGHAVMLSKSKSGLRLCNFFETIAEIAQKIPDATAINMLTISPEICSGSKISTMPNNAKATASHCQPSTF